MIYYLFILIIIPHSTQAESVNIGKGPVWQPISPSINPSVCPSIRQSILMHSSLMTRWIFFILGTMIMPIYWCGINWPTKGFWHSQPFYLGYKIKRNFHKWARSILFSHLICQGDKQFVDINGGQSSYGKVTCGVQQGWPLKFHRAQF